ncbi:hypothetical protein SLA2020_430210 [Shorea laevis]
MSGPQCCSHPPTLDPSSGAGHVVHLGGLSSYVVGSADSKLAVLIISDVFGYEAPNLRKVADKVAAAGFYVVVPDFMHGDPYVIDKPERPLPIWLKDHGTDTGFEEAKAVIEALKSEGVLQLGLQAIAGVARLQLNSASVSLSRLVCYYILQGSLWMISKRLRFLLQY